MLLLGVLLSMWSRGAVAVDSSQAAARIDSLLSQEYPAGEPGAAVLVSKTGAVVLKKGYGLADVERHVPVTPETPFRLASVTKMFTATAVLMLAERGRLSLDDTVAKFFPALLASGEKITVRHLLAHTSGIADYLDRPDSMAWARNEHSVQDLLDGFKDRPSSFAPGEKTAYSNSNAVLLGAIIEKIAGVRFGEFARTGRVEPQGLAATAGGGKFTDVRGIATPYEPARTAGDQLDWGHWLVARPYTSSAVYSAGGCVSSAEDLARFHGALLAGGLLGKRSLAENFEPAALNDGRPGTISRGGWQLDKIQGRRAAMHGGALPGVCTWVISMPDDDVVVILLSNRTPGKPRCGMLAVQVAGVAIGR